MYKNVRRLHIRCIEGVKRRGRQRRRVSTGGEWLEEGCWKRVWRGARSSSSKLRRCKARNSDLLNRTANATVCLALGRVVLWTRVEMYQAWYRAVAALHFATLLGESSYHYLLRLPHFSSLSLSLSLSLYLSHHIHE